MFICNNYDEYIRKYLNLRTSMLALLELLLFQFIYDFQNVDKFYNVNI